MDFKKIILNRVPSKDVRNKNFPLRKLMDKVSLRTFKYHYTNRWTGNQGYTPECTAYGGLHWLHSKKDTSRDKEPAIDPTELYKMNQKNDEWFGEDYDGTSTLGLMKSLKQLNLIDSYYWAYDFATFKDFLLNKDAIIIGTNWYSDMFEPKNGLAKIGGELVGGHLYEAVGINTKTRLVKFKNSWGTDWGKNGYFWMGFDDVSRLISEYGEVAYGHKVNY